MNKMVLTSKMLVFNFIFGLCSLWIVTNAQSPVFVATDPGGASPNNNKDAVTPPTFEQKSETPDVVTQTVYGFLDFTTTIGNTVMVFSPQSSSVTTEMSSTTRESTTVINDKPQISIGTTASMEIKPDKASTVSTKLDTSPQEVKQATNNDDKVYAVKPEIDYNFKNTIPVTEESSTSESPISSPFSPPVSFSSDETKKSTTVEKISNTQENTSKPNGQKTSKSLNYKPVIIGSKVEISTGPTVTPSLKNKKNEKPKFEPTTGNKTTTKTTSSTTAKNNNKSTTVSKNLKSTAKTTTANVPTKNLKPKIIASKVEVRTTESTASVTNSGTTKSTSKTTGKSKIPEDKFEIPESVDDVSDENEEVKHSSEDVSSKLTSVKTTIQAPLDKSTETKATTTEQKSVTTPVKSETRDENLDEKGVTNDAIITEEPAIISSNGVVSPEYDYLSRQPSEVVDETFRVIDLRPNSSGKYQKSKNSGNRNFGSSGGQASYQPEEVQPTGLLTSVTDTIVKDGVTTFYETSVIGTIVSGKYAQVLQSTSHITGNQKKIRPTSSSGVIRILKTAAPSIPKANKAPNPNLEPTTVYDINEDPSSLPNEAIYNTQVPGGNNQGHVKVTKKPAGKNRYPYKNKQKEDFREDYGTTAAEEDETLDTDFTAPGSPTPPPTQSYKKATTKSNKATTLSGRTSPKYGVNNRYGKPTTPELATVSVFSETVSSVTPSYGSSNNNRRFSPSNKRITVKPVTNNAVETERNSPTAKRSYKQKIVSPSNVIDNNQNQAISPSSSTYKFKLSRPSGRWQYKTSPKPRVTIRRQDDVLDNVTVNPLPQFTPDVQLDSSDQELSSSGIFPGLHHEDNSIVQDIISPSLTAETLRVEISTPPDFRDVYYEIATIKSPYTYQVGSVRNTRFVTVTSTYEKNLLQTSEPILHSKTGGEPLSENILATVPPHHHAYDKEPPLDSSIATLPPIGLAGDAETPPLETITESFSTTQLMLKTHILPVVRGGSDTTQYTLVQSYHVTRLVTATKTLPPMEVYQFVPSKTLNEFNTRLDEAGSELHLDLDFADNNEHDEGENYPPNVAKALLSDLDLTNIGSDFDISDVDKNKLLEAHLRAKKAHHKATTPISPSSSSENPTTPAAALSADQLQQLALLRLLNPNAAVPNVITSSKPILKVETAYETHIIPIFNGASTYFTTISRPTATVTKTDFEYVTSTVPLLQPSAFNPLFPQQPSFQVVTTPIVTQTLVTETNSKVLKLNFGAKTSYTTLFSTKVSPTVLTTYLTSSIAVQPTAAGFPSFYNPPYVPFPFMG